MAVVRQSQVKKGKEKQVHGLTLKMTIAGSLAAGKEVLAVIAVH